MNVFSFFCREVEKRESGLFGESKFEKGRQLDTSGIWKQASSSEE